MFLRFFVDINFKLWGAFNKFQNCSSQWAHTDSWKTKLLWSCTATIVHHLPRSLELIERPSYSFATLPTTEKVLLVQKNSVSANYSDTIWQFCTVAPKSNLARYYRKPCHAHTNVQPLWTGSYQANLWWNAEIHWQFTVMDLMQWHSLM